MRLAPVPMLMFCLARLALQGVQAGEDVKEWSCGVLAPNADGKMVSTSLQSLKVLDDTLGDAPFALPLDAPKGVVSIMCGRSSLVPAANDYKVLQIGLTLGIVEADRVAVLEVSSGHLRLRAVSGAFTPDEEVAIEERLNDMQLRFDGREPNKSLERSRER